MRIFDQGVGTCHTVSYRMIEISKFTPADYFKCFDRFVALCMTYQWFLISKFPLQSRLTFGYR